VVGADGINSVVRRSLFGEEPLRYGGHRAWPRSSTSSRARRTGSASSSATSGTASRSPSSTTTRIARRATSRPSSWRASPLRGAAAHAARFRRASSRCGRATNLRSASRPPTASTASRPATALAVCEDQDLHVPRDPYFRRAALAGDLRLVSRAWPAVAGRAARSGRRPRWRSLRGAIRHPASRTPPYGSRTVR
jgi:2-polyprenyl-6-methoxyphenol hydroxylase-like FAD-dependent oxidoreductase